MEPAARRSKGAMRLQTGYLCRLKGVVLCTLIIVFLLNENTSQTEAKKIKLKDLKKLKKYAVLLAGQRKILYAIPFPVPLPVFVKRQHIYTHVPIIPRYVQQPSHSSPYYYPTAMAYGGHDPYSSMSEHSTQVAEHPVRQATSGYSAERNKPETSSAEQETVALKSGSRGQSANAGKYLAQLASTLVGQGAMGSLLGASEQAASGGGSQVAKKLLGGSQAKLMSPSAFVATLRGRPSGAASDQQEVLAEGGSSKLGKYTASELAQMSSVRSPDYQPLPEPLYMAPPGPLYRMPAVRGHAPPAVQQAYHRPYYAQPHPFMEPMQNLEPNPLLAQEEPAQLEMAASEAGHLATLRALVEAKQQHLQQVSQQMTPAQLSVDELRTAESNLLALRAHQLGLTSARLRLLNY